MSSSPAPFDGSPESEPLQSSTILDGPSQHVRSKLYISHFLSTWNSRVFEFGAVLFLSTIFPGTLLPASVYASTRAISVIVFSRLVGHFIDHGERMRVIRLSILGQRLATALSCLLLWCLASTTDLPTWVPPTSLAILAFLACVEKLSSVTNTISIERDWVVVISEGNESDLQHLNSQMRRIDLFCKLLGPLAIALVDGFSTKIAILVTFAMTCVSVAIEYFAIAKVYQSVLGLQQRPNPVASDSEPNLDSSVLPRLQTLCSNAFGGISFYVTHRAFLPSLSLSLLYLTVLSFGGQMVAYLLAVGFTSTSIGLLRTVSTVLELSATWLAPQVMSSIGPIRGGIWFLNWQLAMVALSVVMLWTGGLSWAVAGLLTGVIMSRVGLWGFDLSAQIIIQESVEADHRGSFSAIEASVQSAFELLSFTSTIVFARPAQFKYPAAISGGAVLTAGVLFACYVRIQRGHLFHAPKCIDCVKSRGHSRYALVAEVDDES